MLHGTLRAAFCACVLCACALMAAQAPPARRVPAARSSAPVSADRVGGRVVSSLDGHAIPNAVVTLQESASASSAAGRQMRGMGGNRTVASARSDAEGRYRFAAVPAGKYSLHASAPGYLSAAYQDHEGFSTALVLGAGLPVDALVLSLMPSAVISGRVVDEAGDAVQHAQVSLYREAAETASAAEGESPESEGSRVRRARSVTTNDDGSYEFAGIAPGRFYLSVSGAPWYGTHPRPEGENMPRAYRSNIDPALDVAYPELFYPNSTDSASATPLAIKAGDRLTANFVMQPERALSLTVRLPAGGSQDRVYPQLMRYVFGNSEPAQFQISGQSGRDMVFTGLPPGHYALQAFAPGNRMPMSGGEVDLSGASASVDFAAAGAAETANVHVVLHPLNGASLPSEIELNLRAVRGASLRPGALSEHLKGTGEVVLANVPQGDYRFSLYSDGKPLSVVGVASGGKRSKDDVLRVRGSSDLSVDLTISTYSPSMEGFVQQDGKAAPGTMVVLVPAGADSSTELFRRDQSDLDGSFLLNDVVPGDYLLVAIEDGWKLPLWNDAAALTPYLTHGTPVTVAASGSGTVRLVEKVVAQPR